MNYSDGGEHGVVCSMHHKYLYVQRRSVLQATVFTGMTQKEKLRKHTGS